MRTVATLRGYFRALGRKAKLHECWLCGAAVVDVAAHLLWHDDMDRVRRMNPSAADWRVHSVDADDRRPEAKPPTPNRRE